MSLFYTLFDALCRVGSEKSPATAFRARFHFLTITLLLLALCHVSIAHAGTWTRSYAMTISGAPGTDADTGNPDYIGGEFRNGRSYVTAGPNVDPQWSGSIDENGFSASGSRTDVGQASMELGGREYNYPAGPDAYYKTFGFTKYHPPIGMHMTMNVTCTLTYTPSGPDDTLPAQVPIVENYNASGWTIWDGQFGSGPNIQNMTVHADDGQGDAEDDSLYPGSSSSSGQHIVMCNTSSSGGVIQVTLPSRTLTASISASGDWHTEQILYNYPWPACDILLYYTATPYSTLGDPANNAVTGKGRGSGTDNAAEDTDPSFTRWLPLAFRATIHSQQFRTQPGYVPLPGPWGNLNCAYSMSLQRDTNADLPNASAGLASDKSIISNGAEFIPAYSITDADGDRLLFNSYLTPYSDVRSHLVLGRDGYRLEHAGPPGALKARGNYTYTFETLPSDTTRSARLLSIYDDAGNHQNCTWSWDNAVFLTVTDSTTPRKLLFYAAPSTDTTTGHIFYPSIIVDNKTGKRQPRDGGPGESADPFLARRQRPAWQAALGFLDGEIGVYPPDTATGPNYLSAVVAIGADGTTQATNTHAQFDNGGHLTGLQVYGGDGSGPYRTSSYTYVAGSYNGFPDALASVTQQGVTTQFTYADSQGVTDWKQIPIPKVTSRAAGDTTDTRGSDGSSSSVHGYSHRMYGIEASGVSNNVAAHTDYHYDDMGNEFMSQYSFGSTIDNTRFGVIKSTYTKGPSFAGAPADTNWSSTHYFPDIDHPSQITTTNTIGSWFAAYDAAGNLNEARDPLGNAASFGYSWDGTQLTSATDPTGLTSQFHYGENGAPASRLTSTIDPAGHTSSTFAYNSYGQVIQATNPAAVSATGTDETTHLTYDNTTGDLARTTSPTGNISTVDAYDPLGDPMSFSAYPDTGNPLTSAHSLTSCIAWDPAQEPVSVLLPNGVQSFNTWSNGILTQVQTRGPDGSLLTQGNFSFDSRNRLYEASDRMGTTAGYRYDAGSRLTQVIDANGHTTHFSYGANGEPTGVTWPDGHGTSTQYDAIGRHNQTTDERGITVGTWHDTADRLIRLFSNDDLNADWQFTYDPASRPLTATNRNQSTTDDPIQVLTYHYDHPNKWLTAVDFSIGGNTFTVSYTYYGDGKRYTMTSPAGTTTYGYDGDGRLTSLTNPYGEVTSWTYDHAGRLTGETTASGTATFDTAYTWGVSGQASDPSTAPAYLRTITQQVNAQPFRTYTLTHSYSGQLLEQDGSGQNGMFGETRTFAYDLRGRVTADNESFSSPASETGWNSAFTYDAAGNVQANNPGAGDSAWTYNSSNQVTSAVYWGGTFGLWGADNLSYDASGNLTSFGDKTLTWNVYGQLAEVSTADGWTDEHYLYDCAGRRVCRSNAWGTTYFLYDGPNLIAEIDGWSGQPINTYTYGTTGLISTHDTWGGVSYFHAYDASGNTRALLSSVDGSVYAEELTTAYGDQIVNTAPYGMRFGWQGRTGAYYDGETGLILMGARYYFPDLGRFISRDPAGFSGGMNLYAYGWGDPANYSDPDGSAPCCFVQNANVAHGDMTWAPTAAGALVTLGTTYFSGNPNLGMLAGGATTAGIEWLFGTGMYPEPVGDGCGAALMGVDAALTFSSPAAIANEPEMAQAEGQAAEVCPVQSALSHPLSDLVDGGTCFVAGTPVQMADSTTKPIEDVREGDVVMSRDPNTGKTEPKKVERKVRKHSADLVTIELADAKTHQIEQTLQGTPGHPFFTSDGKMVAMGDLAIGTAIKTRAGPELVVASTKREGQPGGYVVYNFSVADNHTYFVGSNFGGIWVHNDPICFGEPENVFDLGNKGWKKKYLNTAGLVYILRDTDTGELLKVGETQRGKHLGRFDYYTRAGTRNGRNLTLDVFDVPPPVGRRMVWERALRAKLVSEGHALPWDNSGVRLKRSGGGVP